MIFAGGKSLLSVGKCRLHFREPKEGGLPHPAEKDETSLLEVLAVLLPPIPSKGWEGSSMNS